MCGIGPIYNVSTICQYHENYSIFLLVILTICGPNICYMIYIDEFMSVSPMRHKTILLRLATTLTNLIHQKIN